MLREFGADLAKAVGAWARAPMLPWFTLALQAPSLLLFLLLTAAPDAALGLSVVSLGFGVVALGFAGTQRWWYLKVWREERLRPNEFVSLTLHFIPRYLSLGLITGLPIIIVPALGAGRGLSTTGLLITTAVETVWWGWLTFMTPALAFSTDRATEAIRVGWRMIKHLWPRCALYVLVPPIITLAYLGVHEWREGNPIAYSIVWSIGILLTLAFKGATAAFYLRHHRKVTEEMELSWSGPPVEDSVNV